MQMQSESIPCLLVLLKRKAACSGCFVLVVILWVFCFEQFTFCLDTICQLFYVYAQPPVTSVLHKPYQVIESLSDTLKSICECATVNNTG